MILKKQKKKQTTFKLVFTMVSLNAIPSFEYSQKLNKIIEDSLDIGYNWGYFLCQSPKYQYKQAMRVSGRTLFLILKKVILG
ncbi:MAG: hypothetical protein WCD89_26745 [Anaerocolumna sp.]